ncbi:hypothetical protein PWP93_35730 [Paraburkholderia sp. A1RI-2L]|uniref:hypothetical protein n=1 Tax=Paraburkholderia sp. A1RI-2L TaxID=3028367 RepID=UPI003B794DB1
MNTSRDAVPPDLPGDFWQSLVLQTCSTPASYTTRPDWSSDGESMWMRLSKFSLFNRLSLHALAALIAVRTDEASSEGVDLRRADRFVPSRLSSILQIPEASALEGFCFLTGHPALAWAATELRYCSACLELGFHAAWFQWRFIERCPVHGCALQQGCLKCAEAIPYVLDRSMATHPLSCARCNTPWVPVLDRPAGRCAPMIGRAARILRRWQSHVAETLMPVATTPYRPRNQATGRFAFQPPPEIESRMTCLARHTRLLNQLYDVPPPSPLKLLGRHNTMAKAARPGRIVPLPCEDQQTGDMPYARRDWPHFGDDFLAYEHLLKRVGRRLFGDTQGIAFVRRLSMVNEQNEFVVHARETSANQAAALGWSISWYGFSRTCASDNALSMPAVGLTGWLANAPHRPVEISPGQWRDKMSVWLSEDLARSAWAWSRIVLFMRVRGKYLLHGQLVRPSELAALRRHV